MTSSDAADRPPTVGVSPTPKSSDYGQLSSWKEIAHYLGVNVRTAQKWERAHGLPIWRFAGARSRVSTDQATLDAWKRRLGDANPGGERCYSWPLGPEVSVEVRFRGASLGPLHIELLRDYLKLVKTALSISGRR
jgi:excisionase family DNA binding protein